MTQDLALFPRPEPVAVPDGEAPSERSLLDALHRRYGDVHAGARRYIVAEHVRADAGWNRRTADFVACDTWASGKFAIHGHEVKVSRSDWRRELEDPDKAGEFLHYMHRWWLVVPTAGMVHPGELPDGWGLMALRGSTLCAVQDAPWREAAPLGPGRLAALLRAVARTAGQQARRAS